MSYGCDLLQILNHYRQLLSSSQTMPHDNSSLRASVLLHELQNEIDILDGLFETPDGFAAALNRRIVERQKDMAKCLSPGLMAESITNQMYWQLALEVFKPKTLAE